MFKSVLTASVFSAVLCMASVSANAQSADPGADQIYQAASHGHVREAEQMVEQVLRDHPESAKAHYVAAEVYGKAGDVSRARTELSTAEHLKPGLPFANPTAVTALKTELYGRTAVPNPVTRETSRPFAFPWGLSALIVLAVVVIWAVMRRRREAEYRYAAQLPAAAGGPQYGPTYGPTPGVGPVMGGGGLGSGIACPSTVRLLICHVSWSAPFLVRVLVADTVLPVENGPSPPTPPRRLVLLRYTWMGCNRCGRQ